MQKEGVAKKWCYFEATVTEMEESTVISVGVLTLPYPMFRLVGGWVHSIGYRSDSGNVHQDDSDNGRPFAQPYTKGDTIGCGYDLGRGAVFFTINGKLLGDANFGCKLHDYHMAVSANGLCSLIINVGTEPFLFEEANAAGLLDARSGVSPTVGWAAPKLPPSAVRVIVPAYGERAVADADEVTPSPVSEEGETP
ncbi:hypothetical protein DFJ73DRAFT_635504 [Zopfochytrium polystomum]|nr:hypothetical protein DFJ73DRAFT_635504 [Zopfochytrium polystomum]